MGFSTTRCSLSGAPLPAGTPVVALLLAHVDRWVPFGLPVRGTVDEQGRLWAPRVDRPTLLVLRCLDGWAPGLEWEPLASRPQHFCGVELGQAVVDAGVYGALVASARVPAPHGRTSLRNQPVAALVELAFEPALSRRFHADADAEDGLVEALVDLVYLRAVGAAWTPQHDAPRGDGSAEGVAKALVKAKAAMAPWPRAVKELDALVRAWAADDEPAREVDGAVAVPNLLLRRLFTGADCLEITCAPERLAPVLALVRAGAAVTLTSPEDDLVLQHGPTCALEAPVDGRRPLTLDTAALDALVAANARRRPQTVELPGGWSIDLA